jgi:fructokinase
VSGLLDAGLLGGGAAAARLRAAGLAEITPAVERALLTGALTVQRAGAFAPPRSVLP